jgi:hypothetical protein
MSDSAAITSQEAGPARESLRPRSGTRWVAQPIWLRSGAVVAYCLLALSAVGTALRLVWLSYYSLPFADMWNELPFVRHTLAGDFDPGGWWAQHNEHRIVLSRLQFVADYGLFDGRGVFLLTVIFASCVLLAAVLCWPVVRVWNDRVVTLGFFALALWATLTPARLCSGLPLRGTCNRAAGRCRPPPDRHGARASGRDRRNDLHGERSACMARPRLPGPG